MKLAVKMAWEYRWSWLAMFLLTAASTAVLIVSLHAKWANGIVSAETGNASLDFDFYLSVLATLLVTQTIAVLCLESQACDLAIIRTCGASVRALRRTLLGEIMAVTAAGYGLGALVALPIIQPYTTWAVGLSSNVLGRSFGYSVSSFALAAFALGITVYVGSRGTLKRVAKQNVVDALHGETTQSKKRRRVLSGVIAALAIIANILIVAMVFASKALVEILRSIVEKGMPADSVQATTIIASAEGGMILLLPMLFVAGMMVIFAAFAPTLYRWILARSAQLLPANIPGWIEVGVRQATFNATKYYGSITPLVIFILAIVMVFAAIDSALAPITTRYMQYGVDTSTLSGGTDYQAVAMIIGPALFIAFAGSLANMIMSGRGRIYVNKLTAIIGLKGKQQFLQALAESVSYVYVAAVLGFVTMLAACGLAWVAGNAITGVRHAYVVSWVPYLLALLFMLIILAFPAIVSVFRSRRLPSKAVLESFGE